MNKLNIRTRALKYAQTWECLETLAAMNQEIIPEDGFVDWITSIIAKEAELTREETIKEVIELLESTIEKERYSGAPHALNEVIKLLSKQNNE